VKSQDCLLIPRISETMLRSYCGYEMRAAFSCVHAASTFRCNTHDFIKTAGVSVSPLTLRARFASDALLHARPMRLHAKVTDFPPFRGCRDTRRDFVRRGARASASALARDRAGGRARSRFLRHAQWARCDTRAIIRARRLDTFNCHVNLFVPLPIESGRALSRERARESARAGTAEKYRCRARARADDTQWAIHGVDSLRKIAPRR